MRNVFAKELTKAAEENGKVVLLAGDIGNKLFDEFKRKAPDRFYNCGVAEANMTGVAAGLAMMGFRPVTYTIAPFAVVRCIEQIRIDLCYHNVPVIIAGTGAGFSYAELGPTHHSCDDIGLLRMLPNMTIICPCDPVEVRLALRAALKNNGPVYLRLGKKGEPTIHRTDPDFIIGKSITVLPGDQVCVLSTGNVMPLSLSVAETLKQRGISVRVESFHTVKPLDKELLENIAAGYKLVVTVEEHSMIGGLGGSVAEWLADRGICGPRLLRFGAEDTFMSCVGSQDYARSCCGLLAESMSNKIHDVYQEISKP